MSAVDIDLWRWPLTGADQSDLNDQERHRAARFVFKRDRDFFIAARAGLRRILAQYLNAKPAQLQFSYGPFGKPQIAGIEFNLSHTAGLAVLAVGQGVPLGVDIEENRPIEMAVAEAHFAPAEIAKLRRRQGADQLAAFYRCWTRKEAYLKARGTGLSTDLNSFTVTMGSKDPHLINCASGEAKDWRIINIAAPRGVTGALAVRAGGRPVQITERKLA